MSKAASGTQAGLRLSKQKGRGVDFAEVRQYQPGDDIRSIDWRVTARKIRRIQKSFVKNENGLPCCLWIKASICSLARSSA